MMDLEYVRKGIALDIQRYGHVAAWREPIYHETHRRDRLEYLRSELRAERISWGELHELQSLAEHIEPGDVELLEAAGVPEFPEDQD
jgi:hypothetical protein